MPLFFQSLDAYCADCQKTIASDAGTIGIPDRYLGQPVLSGPILSVSGHHHNKLKNHSGKPPQHNEMTLSVEGVTIGTIITTVNVPAVGITLVDPGVKEHIANDLLELRQAYEIKRRGSQRGSEGE